MSEAILDCLIVGAGPAGLTAATYLARFHRHIVLVGAGNSRALRIPVSHNCPGFPFGVSGTDLLARMSEQAAHFGVAAVEARVDRIETTARGFVVHAGTKRWMAHTVVLATGIVDRLPPVRGIEQGIADAVVRICAVCDGYEASDHRIAVYGPAATVVEHAGFLRSYSHRVCAVLSEPGEVTSSHRELASSLAVTVFPPPSAVELMEDPNGRIGGCNIIWPDHSAMFDSLYPVLGSTAQSDLARALGAQVDEDGAVIVDAHMHTSVEGLYAAGDVVSALNQISVAVGHAAIAASAIHQRRPRNPL